MLFDELIITIMKAVNKERTISSPYHLLKGKKSGQTLQDIGYYNLYPFFAVLPRIDKQIYDRSVQGLFAKGLLLPNDQVIELSEKAWLLQVPKTPLNGWKYRGKEMIFLSRLSLIVQTFSHISQDIKIFDPVTNAEDVQSWVKKYLMEINFRNPAVINAFRQELAESIESLNVSDPHKMVLMQRLSGYGLSGLTWEQIADAHGLQILDVQLMNIEILHAWMALLEYKTYPLLFVLMDGIIQQSSLTETAQRTEKLFLAGHSLEEIAAMRGLKTSTIEDHFVELAMNDPHFNYSAFIKDEAYRNIVAVSKKHQTKRLRDIKEKLPDLSYFQIRLALALKEEAN